MEKRNLIVWLLFCYFGLCNAQTKKMDNSFETTSLLEKKIFRLNVLSPGFGFELKMNDYTSLTLSTGITYFGGIEGMNTKWKMGSRSGIGYSFEPFVSFDYKIFYNLEKRKSSGKNTAYNSGNYLSLRSLTLGPAIRNNIVRQSDYDFMFYASWGFQRSYNRIHFLFDMGPIFVFDAEGNTGFFPVMIRLNLGYNF